MKTSSHVRKSPFISFRNDPRLLTLKELWKGSFTPQIVFSKGSRLVYVPKSIFNAQCQDKVCVEHSIVYAQSLPHHQLPCLEKCSVLFILIFTERCRHQKQNGVTILATAQPG